MPDEIITQSEGDAEESKKGGTYETPSGVEITPDYVLELHRKVENWRQPYYDRWLDYYKLYRSFRRKSDHNLRSHLFIPYTFSLIETVVPRMLASVMGASPIVAVLPRTSMTYDISTLIERALSYEMEDYRAGLYFGLETFFKEVAIYGTSFARVLPKFSQKLTLDPLQNRILPYMDYVEFHPLDLFRVYPDWRGTTLKDMRFVMIEHDIDLDILYEYAKDGIIKESDVDAIKEHWAGESQVDEEKKERLSYIDKSYEYPGGYDRKTIKVIEYWDKNYSCWVPKTTGTDGLDAFFLKKDENPFGSLPFLMMKYTSIPHELYGVGVPEIVEDLQDGLNTVRNQRIDNINLIINTMFIANRLADIDFENLVSYAGNIILTNDMDGIKPFQPQDATGSGFREEQVYSADMDMSSGVNRYTRGEVPTQRETGTAIIRLQQASDMRFESILKNIEFGTVRELSHMYIWYTRQFMPVQQFASIVGEKEFMERGGQLFYQLDPDEILYSYHFNAVGNVSTAVKEVRAQQLIQMFMAMRDLPFINQYELVRLILRDAFDLKPIDKVLFSQEQWQQMQYQQMLANAGANAAAGELKQESQGVPSSPNPPGVQAALPGPSGQQGQNIETILRGLQGYVPPR